MTPEVGRGYVSQPSANGEDGYCQFLDNAAHTPKYSISVSSANVLTALIVMITTASILIASTVDLLYALPLCPYLDMKFVT